MSEAEDTDHQGTYQLSSPSGPYGTSKVVLLDYSKRVPPPPPWVVPSKYWAYTKPPQAYPNAPDPLKAANEFYIGTYPTSYEAYVGLTEWAKSKGLTVTKSD
jgi:hypothetical protein